jgi:hypothetical protein
MRFHNLHFLSWGLITVALLFKASYVNFPEQFSSSIIMMNEISILHEADPHFLESSYIRIHYGYWQLNKVILRQRNINSWVKGFTSRVIPWKFLVCFANRRGWWRYLSLHRKFSDFGMRQQINNVNIKKKSNPALHFDLCHWHTFWPTLTRIKKQIPNTLGCKQWQFNNKVLN